MLLSRLDLRGCQAPFESVLPRPKDPGIDVRQRVADVIDQVRAEGDYALRELTRRFDGADVVGPRVSAPVLQAALGRIDDDLRCSLEVAKDRIEAYHRFEARLDQEPDSVASWGGVGDNSPTRPNGSTPATWRRHGTDDEVSVQCLVRPVARAGCYAPGGRARYPSTVLMCALPAKVAGVAEVILCVPPGKDGTIDDASLAAAALAGVDEVYAVGGAQAIAAMALGTASIRKVDIVVGPGNLYVAEAKRQLAGVVGVASAFAGPSEVVVVAGTETDPGWAAIDLLVQAEHGPDGLAWLVTWDEDVLNRVSDEVERMVTASPRRADLEATFAHGGYACLVDDPPAAVDVANTIAPEHLELLVDGAEGLLERVSSAGAVFLGPWSPAALGDYVAGPNHVLPTNRSARFASALRADDFCRHIHAVTATARGLSALAPHVITLATTEGLPAHADAIRIRA